MKLNWFWTQTGQSGTEGSFQNQRTWQHWYVCTLWERPQCHSTCSQSLFLDVTENWSVVALQFQRLPHHNISLWQHIPWSTCTAQWPNISADVSIWLECALPLKPTRFTDNILVWSLSESWRLIHRVVI